MNAAAPCELAVDHCGDHALNRHEFLAAGNDVAIRAFRSILFTD